MSKIWTVTTQQWVKGLALFVIPTLVSPLLEMINRGNSIDLALIGKVALVGALTYISISFSQDSKGVPFGSADKK